MKLALALFWLAPLASPQVAPPQVAPKGEPVTDVATAALDAPIDGTRFALRRSESIGADLLAARARFGAELAAELGSGWVLLSLPEAQDAHLRAEWAVEMLNATTGSTRFAPVLRGARATFGIPTDRLLVQLQPTEASAPLVWLAEHLPEAHFLTAEFAGMPGVLEVHFPHSSGLEVLRRAASVRDQEAVGWVEPVLLYSGGGHSEPNDPFYAAQWALKNTGQDLGAGAGEVGFDINIEGAHLLTTGSADVGVLIIDTGVQHDHPDLPFAAGIDLMDGPFGVLGAPQNSFENHGTAVAGVIHATRNNGIGTAGVAPGCRLLSARCFEGINALGNWISYTGNTALALEFAEVQGARVTVNSNYYGFLDASMEAKYAQTRGAGMVHFVSAGNFSTQGVSYPAVLPTVLAIGATNEFANAVLFTSIGPQVDFAAPGIRLWTTDRTGNLGYAAGDVALVEGTSFSGPLVAGIAALCLSINPGLDADGIEEILIAASVDVVSNGGAPFEGKDLVSGHGQPDATLAVELAAGLRSRLVADGGPFSLWQGGQQTLTLDAGTQAAGAVYLMLGSVTGTSPGLNLPGIPALPLNFDAYTELRLANPSAAPLAAGLGVLDAEGRRTLLAQSGVLPLSLNGLQLEHAALVFDPFLGTGFPAPASNARALRITNAARFPWVGGPTAIPDGDAAGVDFVFPVAGVGGALVEVQLVTLIDTTFSGDLRLSLTSPGGTTVLIKAEDFSQNFFNMNAIFGGYFATAQSMAAFFGQSANGNWVLNVADVFAGDLAQVNGLELVVRSQ